VDELLATPGLEALIVSTGIDTHTDLAIRGMEAGLHVLVEKPLCGTVDEIRQLRAAQRKAGRVVGLGHTDNQTDVYTRIAREFLENGQLGTLACYEENTSNSGGLEIKPGEWRGLRDRNPGGMLIQCGVHALHRLINVFRPVDNLQAMFRYDANPVTQTADIANVLLRHKNGVLGTLNAYHVTGYCHEFRLFGTKENLYIDTRNCRASYQPRLRNLVEERTPVKMPEIGPLDYVSNVVDFFKAIRQGTPASPSLEDGIAAVLPVFATELSEREGRRVSISELTA